MGKNVNVTEEIHDWLIRQKEANKNKYQSVSDVVGFLIREHEERPLKIISLKAVCGNCNREITINVPGGSN